MSEKDVIDLYVLTSSHKMSTISDFELKTGKDRFSPKDLVELPRPSAGKANPAGDLVLVSVSRYSFEENKYDFFKFLSCICTKFVNLWVEITSPSSSHHSSRPLNPSSIP